MQGGWSQAGILKECYERSEAENQNEDAYNHYEQAWAFSPTPIIIIKSLTHFPKEYSIEHGFKLMLGPLGQEEVANKWHLFNLLLKEMVRLNQRQTQIKMLFAYSLVKNEYLQRLRKSPEFTVCSCPTLASLYQQEWAIPSTSVAWKNLYPTKFQEYYNELLANQELKPFSFSNFRKLHTVKISFPYWKSQKLSSMRCFWSHPATHVPV